MSANTLLVEVKGPYDFNVCDYCYFDTYRANRRRSLADASLEITGGKPLDLVTVVGIYMAGMRCPSADRIKHLLRDISDIETWEKRAIRELFYQLSPIDCNEILLSTESTPRELAHLMRTCSITRDKLAIWINQYADHPNRRLESKLAMHLGNENPRRRNHWLQYRGKHGTK